MKLLFSGLAALAVLLVAGCTSVPKGVSPVQNFELEKYLGTWYEIARFDHSFERGLNYVTAEYQLNEDGLVKVINRGKDRDSGEWEQAEGVAKFVDDASTGHLKVSFFGPFYASYVIAELDDDYQYSLVTGPNRDYLWILSRTPSLDNDTLNSLVNKARELGYATDQLIYVQQKLRTE